MSKLSIVFFHSICLLAKLGRKPVDFHVAGLARVFQPNRNQGGPAKTI